MQQQYIAECEVQATQSAANAGSLAALTLWVLQHVYAATMQ